jgi:hypothetical protein
MRDRYVFWPRQLAPRRTWLCTKLATWVEDIDTAIDEDDGSNDIGIPLEHREVCPAAVGTDFDEPPVR